MDQITTEHYALFNADCVDVLQQLPKESVHFSLYSPPFATRAGSGLYQYSSDPRDISNSMSTPEFFQHYAFIVKELHRVTMPGRMTAVHTTDITTGNTGLDTLYDFSGEVIRLHESCGFALTARHFIWKEPLTVRNRTMTKSLSHKMLTEDSTRTSIANADQLLIFRRSGKNPLPVTHPNGLLSYAGERHIPTDVLQYRNYSGSQTENKYSHWIWRQYASSFWDDIRIDRVLPYRAARDADDEKHVHPLQLDVIERAVTLYSNPGETVLTPCMGVGSEVYGAVALGRRGVGIELKPSYYRQACKNVPLALSTTWEQDTLFADADTDAEEEAVGA